MKIWLDLRLTNKDSIYSEFIKTLVEELVKIDKDSDYVIYSNNKLNIELTQNWVNHVVNEKPWSISEQFSLIKRFREENFTLMIFFNHEIPIFYKKDFLLFIPSLKELFFSTKSLLAKMKYNILMNISLKNCKKVICFDKNTSLELNERLNIKESMINTVKPFFITEDRGTKKAGNIKIDIKAKYNLKSDYIIYDGDNYPNTNLTRLFKVLISLKKKDIDINLLMLSNETISDVELREEIIDYNIQDRVFFIWEVSKNDEPHYYKQSAWAVFPSIYESFPFKLSKAVKYNIPIIASNIPSIVSSLWESITTFDPLSTIDFMNVLEKHINSPRKIIDYKQINSRFSKNSSAKELKAIIDKNIYNTKHLNSLDKAV